MVYLPSNGAPTLSIEIAVPACSFGLPRRHPFELGEGAGDLFGDGGRRAVHLGLGAVGDVAGDVDRVEPKVPAMSRGIDGRQHGAGGLGGRRWRRTPSSARDPSPRAWTSLTCSAAVISDRNRSRSAPSRRTSGFCVGALPALWCGVRLLRLPKVELAFLDGDLVADLP